MNRTTKALARLATLAVIAGGALSAPFAIGTASAAVTGVAVVNGTIGSVEDAAAQATYPNIGTVTWTASAVNSTISLAGSGAYFPATVNQPANITVTSKTTATCTVAGPCTARVGDTAPESVSVFIVDPGDATSANPTIKFNGIFITGCPSTGLDNGVAPNVAYGTPAQNTPQNCVTQAQFAQPLTVNAKYLAGGAGVVQGTSVFLAANQQAGANTATCTEFIVTQIDCTADASGNFSFNVINNGVTPPTPPTPEADLITITTRNTTGTYPAITAAPPAGAAPTLLVNWGNGGVTPTRVDATGGLVLSPFTAPFAPGNRLAEPGDVEQGTFLVMGSCTPVAPLVTCDNGTPLAGLTVTVTVDHGFITPNCTQGGITSYAQCSFSGTPAVGAQAGNLTSSGQSATFTTGVDGTFKASFGIARDTAFDKNGLVAIHVTVANLPVMLPGDHTAAVTCTTPTPSVVPALAGGPLVQNGPVKPGCPIDGAWTTLGQPLNGGTAKIAVVPSLSSPNNVAILSENNDTVTTGTTAVNVPDVDRVVFKVQLTDQFQNLTANGGSVAPAANAAKLTKTGPGQLWGCGAAFTSTDACTGGGGNVDVTNTQQSDGTFTEVATALGSFTDANAQNRYQVDTMPNGSGNGNAGYGSVTPSVNDGTTTVVLSWTPPTTTFATYHAGTPTIATFTTGNGAAQTDTLTLNFYNQLSQPVVTFAVSPGNTVGTSTAVTVTATVKDQNGKPIVMGLWANSLAVQVVRSGGNEASCTPIQNAANQVIRTNTSGVAGYTFSCDKSGLSTVSMVVTGPGGVSLASGHEAVTFTGAPPVSTIKEKPGLKLTSPKAHRLRVTVTTHPTLKHKRVKVYRVVNGLPHLIGALGTGSTGKGHVTIKHLKSGKVYRIKVLVVNVSSRYHSVFSKTKHHRVK
jgi:hypothetical protein